MSPITSTTGEMNRTKRRGPRIEPCGTPVSKVSQEEDEESILTKDERFVKYEWIQVWTVPDKPNVCSSLWRRVVWSKVSKAADISRAARIGHPIGDSKNVFLDLNIVQNRSKIIAPVQSQRHNYTRSQMTNFMLMKSCLDVMWRMSCDDVLSWVMSCHHDTLFEWNNSCFIQFSIIPEQLNV